MKRFIDFVLYHNAVPLIVTVLFSGGVAAFAATDGVQSLTPVREPDTLQLRNFNPDTYDPQLAIVSAVESGEQYVITYTYSTLAPVSGAWQSLQKSETLILPKSAISVDELRSYALVQLQEVVAHEKEYLTRARDKELEQYAQGPEKSVSFLSGLSLNSLAAAVATEEANKVVPVPEPQSVVPPTEATPIVSEQAQANTESSSPSSSDTTPPIIHLNGDTEQTITQNDPWSDLGATATDDVGVVGDVTASLDGSVSSAQGVVLDTAVVGDHTIIYTARDAAGNIATQVRTVHVVTPTTPPDQTPPPAPSELSVPPAGTEM